MGLSPLHFEVPYILCLRFEVACFSDVVFQMPNCFTNAQLGSYAPPVAHVVKRDAFRVVVVGVADHADDGDEDVALIAGV